jgi:WD40 repeat protein
MAFQTQGLLGGLEPGRRIISKWKSGRHCEDLEREDRQVRLDAERSLRLVRFSFFLLSSNFLPLLSFSCADSWHCKRRVFSVAWSPDGASLASGSRDDTVKIWNAKTGKCDSTLSGHSDM